MFEPKMPVVAATVGFVLSFLIGMFSGASFPVFFLRALGMALFFGVGALVLNVVMHKFLPELFDADGTGLSNGSSRDSGQMVNVTIGDQEDVSFSPIESSSAEDTGHDATEFAGQSFENLSEEEDVSDLQYKKVDATDTYGDQPVEPQPVKGQNTGGSTKTGEKGGSDSSDSPPQGETLKSSSTGLDVLPDIQDFIPEEKVEEEADFDEDAAVVSTGTGFSVPDVSADGIETETMARAIRTILAKDK